MCGIIGAFSFKSHSFNTNRFIRWGTGRMHRRGPDAEGYSEMGQAIFGFRRLSIRDLSKAANQPMLDSEGRYMLVLNGELYGLEELKSNLKPSTKFRTHSDTEVLFQCLEQLGIEKTLPLLDGIFAFAWYDLERGSLVIARDRCGVKPIYYAYNESLMLFCSEYDLLLCHESFHDVQPNPEALANYLRLGFVPDGEALYCKTYLLPHGHFLTIDKDGNSNLNSFYDFPWRQNDGTVANLRSIITNSVSSQMVSDVSLGVFQSGGIDSSLVSASAIRENHQLESFTIGVESNENMDESRDAINLAGSINMHHHLRNIADTDVLVSLIDQNTQAFSEPFADYSSLPMLFLSQFASEHIKVALSGDGGDELFWGYPRNRHASLYLPFLRKKKLLRILSILREKIAYNGAAIPYDLINYKDFTQLAFQKIFITGAKAWAGRIFPYEASPPFFLKKIMEDLRASPPNHINEWMSVLRKIEFDFHLQRVLLKVDRASMYHSLEVRVPLLSNAMLDASSKYPYSDCIRGIHGKIPLRELLSQMVPNLSHFALPKKGFTVPIDDWISGLLYNRIQERLFEIPAEWRPYIDKKQLEALWYSCRNEKNAWLVWAIFTLFEWSEKRLRILREEYLRY